MNSIGTSSYGPTLAVVAIRLAASDLRGSAAAATNGAAGYRPRLAIPLASTIAAK